MSTKPICIIKIDDEMDLGAGRRLGSEYRSISTAMEEKLPDYHVIVVPHNDHESTEPIQFQVFYDKDFTPIQYEELKQLVTNAIEQTKKQNQ